MNPQDIAAQVVRDVCKQYEQLLAYHIDRISGEGMSEVLAASVELLRFMSASRMTHTPSVGVGPFKTEPTEYEPVTKLRAAIAKATGE